jgi:hypothetical protein
LVLPLIAGMYAEAQVPRSKTVIIVAHNPNLIPFESIPSRSYRFPKHAVPCNMIAF